MAALKVGFDFWLTVTFAWFRVVIVVLLFMLRFGLLEEIDS